MRAAFVFRNLGHGGAQKMMAFAIDSIANLFDEVYVLLEEDDCRYQFAQNVHITCTGSYNSNKSRVPWIGKIINKYSYIIELRKQLKEKNIDIITAFGPYYSFMAVLATKGLKTKTVLSERRAPRLYKQIYKIMNWYAYRKCDMAVFQLEGAKEFFRKLKNYRIIPNPCFKNTVTRDETIDNTIVMAAARLEYEKGFDTGIRAMSIVHNRHPEFRMDIYGHGDFDSMYKELIDSKNDYIVYKGRVDNIAQVLRKAYVFLLPSRSEGIPNILLEAMSLGVPCVAADCEPGGPRMLIGNNEKGLLVKVDDYEEMANGICRLIEDNTLYECLSDNAKKVQDIFSCEEIRKKWRECYLSLIQSI